MRFKAKIFEQERLYTGMTLVFLLIQWVIIALTSVNVPAGDEWEALRPHALPNGFTWEYVFSFHNEHRNVFSNLLSYAFFYLTDWNLQHQIIFNYTIYCSLVVFLMSFQKRYIQGATKGIWILMFFLTSPIICDNHNWAFQSAFHFCLLFGVLALFYATREVIKTSDFWVASMLAICSIYSFSAGLFFGLIVLFVLAYRLTMASKRTVGQQVVVRATAIVTVIGAITAWFIDYPTVNSHPHFTWPYESSFWYFYANLTSLGFGFKSTNALVAFFSLSIVIVILWKNIKRAFSFNQHYISLAFFGSLAILGVFASISLSRTGFGIGQAKTSRYAEFAILLTPLIGWLFWGLAQQFEKFQKAFKYFICFVLLGFAGNYSYGTYFSVEKDRKEALNCIASYYRGENQTGDCPMLYPAPLAERLDTAKKLKLSWVPEE